MDACRFRWPWLTPKAGFNFAVYSKSLQSYCSTLIKKNIPNISNRLVTLTLNASRGLSAIAQFLVIFRVSIFCVFWASGGDLTKAVDSHAAYMRDAILLEMLVDVSGIQPAPGWHFQYTKAPWRGVSRVAEGGGGWVAGTASRSTITRLSTWDRQTDRPTDGPVVSGHANRIILSPSSPSSRRSVHRLARTHHPTVAYSEAGGGHQFPKEIITRKVSKWLSCGWIFTVS